MILVINLSTSAALSNSSAFLAMRTIAKHFEVGRKKVKLADADTVQKVTGFVVGAVPPIGHLTPLTVVIDEQVLGHDLVYGGGGGIDKLLEIDPKEILNYTNATAIDLHT